MRCSMPSGKPARQAVHRVADGRRHVERAGVRVLQDLDRRPPARCRAGCAARTGSHPSSTRPTSRMRTTPPSSLTRTMMSANSSGSDRAGPWRSPRAGRRCRPTAAGRRSRLRPARSARGWRAPRRRPSASAPPLCRDRARSAGCSRPRRIPARRRRPGCAPARRECAASAKFGQVERVVAALRRQQVDDHQDVRRRLLRGDADALHFLRQARRRARDAVLHLHLRHVRDRRPART